MLISPLSPAANDTDATQRLAAWGLGRRLNQLRWTIGQAWVLHDRGLAQAARSVATGLPNDILALELETPAADYFLELAEAVVTDPVACFGSQEHDQQLWDARDELRRLDRLGEFTYPELQQNVCRPLVQTALLAVDELATELLDAEELNLQLRSILRLAEQVDRGLRPTGEVGDMFAWYNAEADTSAAHPTFSSISELFRPNPRIGHVSAEPLPSLCLGLPQLPSAVPADWVRALRLRWRQSPIPLTWCPVSEEYESTALVVDRETMVSLTGEVVTACLADLATPPIRWDSTGRLGVGSVTLRDVSPQAFRLRELFDHFQNEDWRSPIPMPLSCDGMPEGAEPIRWDESIWKDAQKTLRRGQPLRHIKFFRTAGQVAWRWNIAATQTPASH